MMAFDECTASERITKISRSYGKNAEVAEKVLRVSRDNEKQMLFR
jgi:hypothetical protein